MLLDWEKKTVTILVKRASILHYKAHTQKRHRYENKPETIFISINSLFLLLFYMYIW